MTLLSGGASASPSSGEASLASAQRDMRSGYLGGAPGVLVSGSVWAVAACFAAWVSPERAMWALFGGGVVIHPIAVLCARLLGAPGRHTPGNPFGALAMATTFWMIAMLPLAYAIALWRIELFFPAMLLVIGGRYLCFHTLYGNRLYWAMGAVLALAAWGLASLGAPPAWGAAVGACIEIVFAFLLLAGARREAGVQAVPV